jgi:glycosyltransferase involved in cell wall biosynthesis
MGLRSGNDLLLPLRLARLLRKCQVDVVHTRNAEAFFYGAVAARLAGVSAVIHSEHGRTFPGKLVRAIAQRFLLRNVSAAFAVSEQLKQDLIRELGVRHDRIEVLYNGVDTARFSPNRPTLRAGGDLRPLVIGSVGRLVSVKNYQLLLRAIARLPTDPPSRLLLVGEGPERPALAKLAADLNLQDRVEFVGHSEDVPRLLQEMDIFVLPSLSEGMSNTLLEAMAAGAAVLASDVGGNREIIESERSGLLFPNTDVIGAAEQLRRLVSDPGLRADFAQAAVARVRRDFSIDAMLERYESLYRRVWRQSHREPLDSAAF